MTFQEFLDRNDYSKEEQLALTELRCTHYNLTPLEGIENLVNLQSFDCRVNSLTSLEGIEKCIKLRVLFCSRNNLTSVKGIEHLVNLTFIECQDNNLTSLRGIEKLSKLTYLSCYNNPLPYKDKDYNAIESIFKEINKEIRIEKRKEFIGNFLNTNQ